LQSRVAVCCSVVVHCSVLQRAAVCCSVTQCVERWAPRIEKTLCEHNIPRPATKFMQRFCRKMLQEVCCRDTLREVLGLGGGSGVGRRCSKSSVWQEVTYRVTWQKVFCRETLQHILFFARSLVSLRCFFLQEVYCLARGFLSALQTVEN